MAERTKRGEEDRKREDDKMQGEPLDTNRGGAAGTQPANTTRDQGVEPEDDMEEEDEDEIEEEEDEEDDEEES